MKTIKLKTLEYLRKEFGVERENSYTIQLYVLGMYDIVDSMFQYFGEEINISDTELESESKLFRYKGWMFDKRWIDYSLGNEVKKMFDELIKDL